MNEKGAINKKSIEILTDLLYDITFCEKLHISKITIWLKATNLFRRHSVIKLNLVNNKRNSPNNMIDKEKKQRNEGATN